MEERIHQEDKIKEEEEQGNCRVVACLYERGVFEKRELVINTFCVTLIQTR